MQERKGFWIKVQMEMPKSLEINRNNNNKKLSLTERDSTKED